MFAQFIYVGSEGMCAHVWHRYAHHVQSSMQLQPRDNPYLEGLKPRLHGHSIYITVTVFKKHKPNSSYCVVVDLVMITNITTTSLVTSQAFS